MRATCVILDEDEDIYLQSIQLITDNKVHQLKENLLYIAQNEENTDWRRREALNALIKMKDLSIDEMMELFNQSRSEEFKTSLISGMVKLEPKRAIPCLLKIIESPNENIELRCQAIWSLEEVLTSEVVNQLRIYQSKCEDQEVCQVIEEVLNNEELEESMEEEE
ncbi:MAG: HEAT repeat domain-containing protein [Candidatus Hodarchaeales archaeon]